MIQTLILIVSTLLVAATAANPLPGEPDGVDLYKKVDVEFIPGRKAVMTIYQDGAETEKITLSDYNDKDKLHALFIEKGFEKYNEEELAEIRRMKQEVEDAEDKKAIKRLRGNINQLTKPITGGKISSKMLRDLNVADKHMNKAQQKAAVKEKIKEMKQAREDFMMVGMPDDRPKESVQ
ncbi:hypothetical protein QTG54_003838 [Skeletonema marinoi]|uniref:Uncharacterized protein n=1 Tax=Skeletonema marinoi TaxID=267567 RepID=A0AAD8YG11_9STRA|nr:hypothetical protein QTG54_003838 [Skeletonema marinoi]